ncbi:CDP-glucose 4,6-dehydratase [Paenibacillus mucilaginosus 3016]|uniref:CDP-glucose 4,6-dehydratase n=2 Tax=Paenibacillus mucilaginosus TaxID=61624 RepID=H6NAY3_9BACL|nr:CDP-glucose 4,6-dehydratase [Paenibacillus mucilaginosus]AFC31238.1 CDP-glucose 4,6-dehydratase [Paenibacillus mucilaginosus 3016]AFH63564.2 CDP-glucose 4,6-dehydratase [Paenibacillus mucilaginosus K02]WFA19804.1 CDP-glucose 4,6-dehydratase [Paenibacillus mucilaginosus]
MNQEFWKGRKVWLTGHTGFKGTWLSIWLHAMGAEVTGFSLEPPTDPSLFRLSGMAGRMNSIFGDVRDGVQLRCAMEKALPEVVLHLAAQPLVRESYRRPQDTYATNVMGTVNVLEAVRSLHAAGHNVSSVVMVTTDKVYENREWLWGYREDEPLGGYDPYSSSKACAELVTAAYRSSYFPPERYAEHGVAIATARAGNVIGGGDWAADRLLPDCFRALERGVEIVIRRPGATRPWQHVLEPLAGYLRLAELLRYRGAAYAEAWNFGPREEDARTVESIVRQVCRQWGEGAGYRVEEDLSLHEHHLLRLDCSKAWSRLGLRPRWNAEESVAAVLDWVQAYRGGADPYELCLRQIKAYEGVRPLSMT